MTDTSLEKKSRVKFVWLKRKNKDVELNTNNKIYKLFTYIITIHIKRG